MIRRPPKSPLFPDTTLFRSVRRCGGARPSAPVPHAAPAAAALVRTSHRACGRQRGGQHGRRRGLLLWLAGQGQGRSEEHTSELQSRQYLVCPLLLEKNTLIV